MGANERLRVGVVGLGEAGLQHLSEFTSLRNVEIMALCDTNEHKLGKISALFRSAGLRKPDLFADFRQLLDRKDIDAVSITVPRAVRAALAVKACEAGKDVLIEKPCCAGLREGRELEAAAGRARGVVQQVDHRLLFPAPELLSMLTQGSSSVLHISCAQSLQRDLEARRADRLPDRTPAAIEQSIGVLDLARSVMGVRLPVKVSSVGLVRRNLDSCATASFSFAASDGAKRTIRLETRVARSAARGRGVPDWLNLASLNQIVSPRDHGNVSMTFVMPQNTFTVESTQGPSADNISSNSWANFVACVKERNFAGLHNPIHEARLSSALVRLAEASLILGRGFSFDPEKERATDSEADTLVQ
jgi:predicted dehydrogenase